MATERLPKAKLRRRLAAIEEELREWAHIYAGSMNTTSSEWLQGRFQDRYEQLLDVAHTVERARHDLDVLPRLS
jgi:hypothetical protein